MVISLDVRSEDGEDDFDFEKEMNEVTRQCNEQLKITGTSSDLPLNDDKRCKFCPIEAPNAHAGKVPAAETLAELPAKRPVARPTAAVSAPAPGQTPVKSPEPKKSKVGGGDQTCGVVANLEQSFKDASGHGSAPATGASYMKEVERDMVS